MENGKDEGEVEVEVEVVVEVVAEVEELSMTLMNKLYNVLTIERIFQQL